MRFTTEHADQEFADITIKRRLPLAALRKLQKVNQRLIREGKLTGPKTTAAAAVRLQAMLLGDDTDPAA